MSEKPSKRRVVIYTVVFVVIALLIVFLSHRNSNRSTFGRANEMTVGSGAVMPSPMMDNGYAGDEITFESNQMLEESVEPVKEMRKVEASVDIDDEVTIEKRVIKTGNIDMRVNSIEDAMNEIRVITVAHGGDEISSDISKNDTYKNGVIMVKVPVNQYAQTFAAIKKIAPIVTDESSQSQDVTAQFIDLESRIKNKKEHETRLRSFFKKADDVDELIQVERELARVRTEIEQMEGQFKYLKAQTQFSTIHIALLEESDIVVSDSWRPLQVVKDSFNTLIKKSTNLLNIVIRFVITSLPFIILFLIISWFLYFAAKHIFKKEDKKNNK